MSALMLVPCPCCGKPRWFTKSYGNRIKNKPTLCRNCSQVTRRAVEQGFIERDKEDETVGIKAPCGKRVVYRKTGRCGAFFDCPDEAQSKCLEIIANIGWDGWRFKENG